MHSIDSARLADAVNELGVAARPAGRRAVAGERVGEETKGGYRAGRRCEREAERLRGTDGIRVRGVMTMAPFDADEATLRTVFAGARAARELLRAAGHPATELSMGMSNDYEVAVEEGATLVRLGTILFGARPA